MRFSRGTLLAVALSGTVAACSLNTAGEGPADGEGHDVADADGAGPDLPEAGDADARDALPETDDTPPGDGADIAPFCGNGVAEEGEACDGADLRGGRCEDFGRLAGTLACTPGCMIDLEGCPPPASCGNGVVDAGEACDNDDLDGHECTDFGYASGTLACTPGCTFDFSACVETCVDDCPVLDDHRCLGTTVQVCGCREWVAEHDCAADDMVCDPSPGAVRCLGGSGDSCDSPRVVGDLPLGVSGGDITTAFHDYQDFTGSRCDTASGVEAVFVRYMTAGETVRVRETGTVDVVLRVLSTCSNAAACLASRNEPETPGLTFTAPADGNYYFVVEAVHAAPSSRGYNITIEDAPGGELCSDPLVADSLPFRIHAGDIRTAYTDDIRFTGPGCTPADGIDVVLARAMTAGETVRLRESASLDVVLRVLSRCDPTAPCLVSRDEPEDPGVTFTAPTTGTYTFVVEAKLALPTLVGYDITLEDAPDGNLCTDPFVADPLPVRVHAGDIRASFTDDVRFLGPGCSPADGVELFFRRDMIAGETARIYDTGSVDLVLRVVASCDPAATCLADRNEPESPGLTFTAPTAGSYWFVAEAVLASPTLVGYDVTIDRPPAGNVCTDPLPASVPFTLSGSDFAATYTNDLRFTGLGCTPADGPEVVLAVAAREGDSFRVNELGSMDVVLRVLSSCDPASSCLYSQDSPENPGILFVAPAAGTYFVVVESVLAAPTLRAYDIRLAAP
jgi:hypothetical protein